MKSITWKEFLRFGVYAYIPNKKLRNVLVAASYTNSLIHLLKAFEHLHK